jgi:hypothetical protein
MLSSLLYESVEGCHTEDVVVDYTTTREYLEAM